MPRTLPLKPNTARPVAAKPTPTAAPCHQVKAPEILLQDPALQSVVSVDQCASHLSLLRIFNTLRGTTEQADLAYLCHAERRYALWMDGLAKAIAAGETQLVESPPMPPVDVALVWAAHLLSPLRYMDDVIRSYGAELNLHAIKFPLEDIVAQYESGTESASGLAFWIQYVSSSEIYTGNQPDASPAQMSVTCPLCAHPTTLDSASAIVGFRVHGQSTACMHCATEFTMEHVAAKRFLTDLVAFRADPKAYLLPGCHFDKITRGYSPSANRAMLFNMFVRSPTWTAIATEYASATPMTKDISGVLHMASMLKPGMQPWFTRLILSYTSAAPSGTMFSLDLVQAVIRQREFTAKMSRASVQEHAEQFAARGRQRYLQFLMLIQEYPAPSVPTLDIDLAWHTHQLMAGAYTQFTRGFLGFVLNHDDTVAKDELQVGDEGTAQRWMAKYGEPYHSCAHVCSAAAIKKQQIEAGCSGTCTGSCQGACVGRPDLAGCSGACTGSCQGACAGRPELSGCSGACTGSCQGACAGRPELSGCSGACTGSCQGACAGRPELAGCSGSCTGSCQGACAGRP